MAVSIVFGAINVNSINTDATVSIGENSQPNWDAQSKNNYGNGVLVGNVIVPNNIIFISDNDLVDSPINDPDIVPSVQNQSV